MVIDAGVKSRVSRRGGCNDALVHLTDYTGRPAGIRSPWANSIDFTINFLLKVLPLFLLRSTQPSFVPLSVYVAMLSSNTHDRIL